MVKWGIIYGTTIGVIKGDTRSLDYSSFNYAVARAWLALAYPAG